VAEEAILEPLLHYVAAEAVAAPGHLYGTWSRHFSCLPLYMFMQGLAVRAVRLVQTALRAMLLP